MDVRQLVTVCPWVVTYSSEQPAQGVMVANVVHEVDGVYVTVMVSVSASQVSQVGRTEAVVHGVVTDVASSVSHVEVTGVVVHGVVTDVASSVSHVVDGVDVT